ncbi:transcriptional regulator, PadR-like family [Catenulispora acidiphila DSM 44928]|uniref:Transcriptional regulator, PadR-like family n=1 Tax=Catenulispora acidiphila (strain DSM 44928 / JCM 14897 / NBRC 102108 / NRRL B-24433 / ID139908) TaxID=479433 RepID=C7QEY5_CATAD|nr:PadR family transcriptional regulator [Catenulispora acidiphila]ACU74743.1 transcriptional regulator, PadR-like family [Catenulispora acidiphila DSM 44928]
MADEQDETSGKNSNNGNSGNSSNNDKHERAEQDLREQLEQLKEQGRRLQEEAAQRERDLQQRLNDAALEREKGRVTEQEARERVQDFKARRREERDEGRREGREDRRGPRRGGGRGGYTWASPGTPPLPPMPPMPPGGPLPPIPGAGGTFTPFDVLGGLGAMFGGPPPGGPAGRRRHGGRSRAGRGDVRITILILLDEGPANGYQLMQEIEQRTNGAWKPSSGSIYPALQQLEDEGIVQTTEGEGRKMFALSDEGKTYVRDNRAKWTAPWEGMEEEEGPSEEATKIRDVIAQLAMAYMQVIQVGTDSQRAEASRVLVGARQALYRILAGDSSED